MPWVRTFAQNYTVSPAEFLAGTITWFWDVLTDSHGTNALRLCAGLASRLLGGLPESHES